MLMHTRLIIVFCLGTLLAIQTLHAAQSPRAGQFEIQGQPTGSVYPEGEPVDLQIYFKPRVAGQLKLHAQVVDYFQNVIWKQNWNQMVGTDASMPLSIALGKLPQGYFELHIDAQITDSSDQLCQSQYRYTFGVTTFLNLSARQAREQGRRLGMKMLGPVDWTDCYGLMQVCNKVGLLWTRQLFTREIDKLDAIGSNVIIKVEGIPENAYDESTNGPREQYKRRHFNWYKASVPLKQPYQDWLRQMVSELPKEQSVFEIWNEAWGKFSPQEFATICNWTQQAIRDVRPDAKIGPNLGHLEFDAPFIQAGGMQGMDILVLHPYGHPERSDLRKKIRSVRAFYESHLGRKIDMYATEYGSSTPPHGPQSDTSEANQAQRAVRSSLVFFAEDFKAMTPHVLIQREAKANDQQDWFGYFRRNGQPKPALLALATLARVIDGGSYAGDLFLKQEVGSMLFEKNGQHILALWTNDVDVDVQVPTGVEQVTRVDIVGSQTQLKTPNGKIDLTLMADPVYLVGVSSELAKQTQQNFQPDQFIQGLFVRNKRLAHKAQTPITIDGNIADGQWDGQTTIDLQLRKQNPTDVSAIGYVAWDEKYLYIAAKVTDDDPFYNKAQPESVYDGDCLELWVGSDIKYQIPEFIHSHDQQMFFAPTCITGQPVTGKVVIPNQKLAPIEGLKSAFKKTDIGWNVELAIPLSYFKDFEPKVGHVAAMEMRINDVDAKHKRYKADPVDGKPSHFDATLWSTLELIE
jgi:hypothetical protein